MPRDPVRTHTLSEADLAFALSRIFARRHGRTPHQRAIVASAVEFAAAEMVARELLAEGFAVTRRIAEGTAPLHETGPALEHPAD